MPIDWSPAKRRQKDIDATWTKKHGKSYFGYKLSANVDKRYKLIRKVKVSTASEHDTLHLDEVLDTFNTSRELYADKDSVENDWDEITDTGYQDCQWHTTALLSLPLDRLIPIENCVDCWIAGLLDCWIADF